ncbi:Imm32 family immunity protein [Zooshikella ganghwensis]|uniref:Uncharacterized protein n=1 Tax=Zooshikella ganghwensis TaxID=202772 RepID=A0A4P9VKA1_9GAMM|nr:hypothetical protein [Zooshikella ganghwensis]RDH43683.1 hypothetical protein B9G39_09660 [Zooshikella ganghwensis]
MSEQSMKIFGYSNDDSETLLEMKEVSFLATPEILREIAEFLMASAEKFESDNKVDHLHFQDFFNINPEIDPDVISVKKLED